MVVSPSPPKKAWHGDALLRSEPSLEPAFYLQRLLLFLSISRNRFCPTASSE